ncbi:MAG: type II toxin-antitoxin system RelE/ParE family toxin [Thermomicrobiales bacterium]
MSVPRSITYSRKARADLAGIAKYTQEQWGTEQRVRYLALLRAAVIRLAEFPELGEPESDIAVGIRAIRVEMHIVYYRVTPKTIRVLRIRHIRATTLADEDL